MHPQGWTDGQTDSGTQKHTVRSMGINMRLDHEFYQHTQIKICNTHYASEYILFTRLDTLDM